MLNLLKADLYRITRVHGLRGALWQYLGFCLAVYALLSVRSSCSIHPAI